MYKYTHLTHPFSFLSIRGSWMMMLGLSGSRHISSEEAFSLSKVVQGQLLLSFSQLSSISPYIDIPLSYFLQDRFMT